MNAHIILFATAATLAASPVALAQSSDTPVTGASPALPQPDLSHSAERRSKVVGWPAGAKPQAPAGFEVKAFATGLDYPRWMHVLPNGDVLVSEARTAADELSAERGKGPSANRITLLRDADKDGVAEKRFVLLADQKQPFGMLARDGFLYVANTDALMRFPFKPGDTKIEAKGEKIMDLPAGGYNNHWTRNVVASPDGTKLFVTVGSASNVGEHGIEEEKNRAAIHEISPDGGDHRILASGLRNPNGIDFEPESGLMWTAVNERDKIGDNLVPDYITSVKDGGFYGWPYSYWGKTPDPRLEGKGQDLVETALTPDYAVGPHVAAMSVRFNRSAAMPDSWRNGAFVALHGSWNRSDFSGYKVLFVPFEGGKPAGPPKDFMTGFVADAAKDEVHGRPTGVEQMADGALLVTDDAADTIWRVAPAT